MGGPALAGTKLKAASGWHTNPGTDDYGFSALPAGFYFASMYSNLDSNGYWWTATASNSFNAYSQNVNDGDSHLVRNNDSKLFALSVRCLKD